MNTEDYSALDQQHLWHPYTKHTTTIGDTFPIISRAEGPYLYDTAGTKYLDAISSWWCCNLGHSHPRLVSAIKDQADRLQHSILGNLTHPWAIELAAKLAELCGNSGSHVLFSSDGASAVEAALKVAMQYRYNIGQPGRNRFASLEQAYHGDTIGAMSVGYLEHFHQPFQEALFSVHRAKSPCCALCDHNKTPDTCDTECFESMEKLFDDHGTELTAVIVEPLCQGAAGMRIYAAKYLRKLSSLCKLNDTLLIVDEIAVGMGRTGRMFAFQHAGIEPDIVCVGKGLSGGTLPISATIVSDTIYATFTDQPHDHTLYHGHTFAGNPLACAAALETLAIYEEEDIPARAHHLGTILAAEIKSLLSVDGVSAIRSLGMIAAMNVNRPARLRQRLLAEHNILIRPLGNVAYLMLPLVVDEALIRDTVRAFSDSLTTD